VTELTTANHEEFIKADKLVVVAYLTSPTDKPADEFTIVAEEHREDYLFGLSVDPEVISAAQVTAPAIVIYRSFDEPRVEYPYPTAPALAQDIESWVKELAIPILDEVNADNYALYAQSKKPLAYLFIDPADEKKQELIDAIRPVAARYKSKVNTVWIDAVKFSDHAKALNLQEAKWPSFVIQELVGQLKYPYSQNQELSAAGVEDWVAQFVDGKLEPQLKSQPVPESQDESVYTVVSKNFEEIVFDDSKDVFLELYATWYVKTDPGGKTHLTSCIGVAIAND
jgi:protein disulfide-isomerase A1